jgi:hypothetical protein
MDHQTSIIDGIDYSRQQQLESGIHQHNRYSLRSTYIIVGCGGIGFWAGLMLAMFGITELVLIDGDKIEASNLNRLPVPPTWVGVNKAIALRKLIRQLRPATTINCLVKHMTTENMSVLDHIIGSGNETSVIDCTDNAIIQKQLYALTAEKSCRYLKIGYEGLNVGWYPAYDVWIPDNYQPGYRTTQSNVISSAVSAGLGILSTFYGNGKDVNVNLHEVACGINLHEVAHQ